jgi:predicted dehydrogenase
VCEKPLAMNSEETGELLRLAEESGLVHAVNFNIRFYAQNQAARARVQAGEIGDVRLISGGYLQDWLLYDTDWNWRLDPAAGGSLRAVGDIGSHWLDLVTFITGRHVDAVMADLTTFIGVRKKPTGPVETFTASTGETVDAPMETEDSAGILLRLTGGARAVATVSQVSAGRKNRLSWEIDGSQGALAWHSEAPEELWVGHRDRPNELLLREAGDYPPGHAEGFPDTFKHLYRAVYSAVAAGGPPDEPDYPTFVDGHEEALIGDAIAQSHAEQRWVNVAPVAVP